VLNFPISTTDLAARYRSFRDATGQLLSSSGPEFTSKSSRSTVLEHRFIANGQHIREHAQKHGECQGIGDGWVMS